MIPAAARTVTWSPFMFNLVSTIILMAGSIFVMWLGERITDRGIGNGISLIIMIGIVARLPYALFAEAAQKFTGNGVGGPLMFVVEMVVWVHVILAAIALVQAVRRVPVQYAKRVIGNKQYGGVRQYIPLKINAAGVMPIIFAQALMMFPMLLGRYDATRGIAAAFSSYTSVWYNIVFGLLVIIFTYFYTAVTVNPTMMAEDMKKNGGFIPGVKPGKKTAEYLDSIMTKVTLPGSIFLAIIACLPALANVMGVNNQFASFFGGTSLLIMVGVILDTLQQTESYLLMRHYDGLMKTGRLTGRSGM
jgi:preprotein translocase subunit SecY